MPAMRAALAALALAISGLAAAGLSGCAPTPLQPALPHPAQVPRAAPPAPAPPVMLPSLADLPGWRDEDHLAALRAYRSGCGVARDPGLVSICARARALALTTDAQARRFFEVEFRPEVLPGPGLLTAYFAPEYPARTEPDAVFSAPLRSRPDDLVVVPPGPDDPPGPPVARFMAEGQPVAYPDRAAIELVPPVQALAWMRPEDLFFLQIQGSGGLVFPDGRRAKAVYAGDNGRSFVAIAPMMVRQGLLAPDHASGEAIRAWLAAHRGPEAEAEMDLDPRYTFFNLEPDDGRDPVGAAGVSLPAGRAIAVDPAWRGYGELYWIDAVSPVLAGARPTYRRLVMALDTGSAIRGASRADLYMGRGSAAGLEAGRVRHTLLLVRLVPVGEALAARIPAGRRNDEAPAETGGG